MGERQSRRGRSSTRGSGSGGRRRGGSGERRGGDRRRGRFGARSRRCFFCGEKITEIDYKRRDLRRFLNEAGKIRPRRRTGTCNRHQRGLATAIKRARHLALLPFVTESKGSR